MPGLHNLIDVLLQSDGNDGDLIGNIKYATSKNVPTRWGHLFPPIRLSG
jgi:hypothetical protein